MTNGMDSGFDQGVNASSKPFVSFSSRFNALAGKYDSALQT